MATLLNSKVGDICIGRTSSNAATTVRLGACAAGDGPGKTAVGFCASVSNSGSEQTAFGYKSLESNTSDCNTAIGSCTLLQGGTSNTAIGHCALKSLSSGSSNSGIGMRALTTLTTGSNSVGVGYYAGTAVTTGTHNTFVGAKSQMVSVTNGNRNVAIGYRATVCGSYNVAIGCCAQSCGTCSIVIGNGASIASGSRVKWGSSVNNTCNCVWGTWLSISDCRDKTDIIDLNDNLGINLIRKLKPVEYRNDNRQSYVYTCGFDFGVKDGTLKVDKKHYGFLAQDVKESADELNVEYEAVKYDDEDDTFKLNYNELIASIVKTIKTIDNRVQLLKTKI
jgi:hypothetical protein